MTQADIESVNVAAYDLASIAAYKRTIATQEKRIEALIAENRNRIDIANEKDRTIRRLEGEVSVLRQDLDRAHRELEAVRGSWS
jgi:hypothetical protein